MHSRYQRGHEISGLASGEHKFTGVAPFRILQLFTHDPAILQTTSRPTSREQEEYIALHQMVQRALTGEKAKNVPHFARYITEMIEGKRQGILPPMHLWTEEKLELSEDGSVITLPIGLRTLAIDGETQLTSHYVVFNSSDKELREKHSDYPLDVIIHHGVPEEVARQFFYDLNLLSIRPNASVGMSMNAEDLFTQVTDRLDKDVPSLVGLVDRQGRQLSKKSPRIVTFHSLRQMVVNIAKGIGGVQYGTRPVPIDGVDKTHLAQVADEWVRAIFDTFKNEIENREAYVLGSPGVLAAVGALGRDLYEQTDKYQRDQRRTEIINMLRAVDWHKGSHWDGVAGKMTPKGLSVGGPKEVSYNVFNALTDHGLEQYTRIRNAARTAA